MMRQSLATYLGIIALFGSSQHNNNNVVQAQGQQPPFSFFSNIAQDFLANDDELEASGVDIAPDKSHLVIVTDEGEIMFLNLLDYDSGHCIVDMSNDKDLSGTDLEGVAFDPSAWSSNDMNVYVVHEGSDDRDDDPYLYKIQYDFDPSAGSCSASVVNSKSLKNAIPCLETSNGIESLGLKSASTSSTDPAVFFVGIQDTGKIYEVTSEGLSNGQVCYDGGIGREDVSATTYIPEFEHIWSFIDDEDQITVVDASKNCPVAAYDFPSPSFLDEEGLVIDTENDVMYIVVDGQGDGSVVSVYNLTYPSVDDLDECLDGTEGGSSSSGYCGDFELCGGGSFPTTTLPATTTSAATTGATTSVSQSSSTVSTMLSSTTTAATVTTQATTTKRRSATTAATTTTTLNTKAAKTQRRKRRKDKKEKKNQKMNGISPFNL